MSERSLWYDGTRHLWLIWNFQIGTSLSNSNRKFRFESESNLEASQVPTNYCPCAAVAQWLSCWTFAQQTSVQVPLAPVRVIVASGQESDCFCSHSAKKSHFIRGHVQVFVMTECMMLKGLSVFASYLEIYMKVGVALEIENFCFWLMIELIFYFCLWICFIFYMHASSLEQV